MLKKLSTAWMGLWALTAAASVVWQEIPGGAYADFVMQGVQYGAFRADVSKIRLLWRNQQGENYRKLRNAKEALEAQGYPVYLLMNAGIFDIEERPAGLWIEDGAELKTLNLKTGQGNFHIQPNGVFLIEDQQAKIISSAEYAASKPQPQWALQSGPLLLINGVINPRFRPDLHSPHRRNAVCVDQNGVVIFVMSLNAQNEMPNFYDFASALQALECQQALYLDGSLATWFIPGRFSVLHFADLVGMIAVVGEQKISHSFE